MSSHPKQLIRIADGEVQVLEFLKFPWRFKYVAKMGNHCFRAYN